MITKNEKLIGTFSVGNPSERKNPKTGKREYRARFTYYTSTGERKVSNGKWLKTRKEAIDDATNLAEIKVSGYSNLKPKEEKNSVKEIAQNFYDQLQHSKAEVKNSSSTKYTKCGDIRTLFLRDDAYTPKEILSKSIKNLNTKDIAKWLFELQMTKLRTKDRPMSYVQYEKYRTCMKDFVRYAHKTGCFDYDHSKATELIDAIEDKMYNLSNARVNKRQKKDLRVMTEEQFRRFQCYGKFSKGLIEREDMVNYNKFDRELLNLVMFELFFYGGVRTAELRPLRWKDISFSEDKDDNLTCNVYIRTSWGERVFPEDKENAEEIIAEGKPPKTENAERILPIKGIFADDMDFYERYFKYFYQTDDISEYLLFPAEKGGFIADNTIDDALKHRLRCLKDEIPAFSKHDFRASCAYRMLSQGYPYGKIYTFFGHGDEVMLRKVYDRLNAEAEQERNKLDNTLSADAFGAKEQEEYIDKMFNTNKNED